MQPEKRPVERRHARAVAVFATVALAVALNTALFSIVDGLLFRPLPFPGPDELVAVDFESRGGTIPPLAYDPALADQRDALRQRLQASGLISGSAQAGAAVFFERRAAEAVGVRAAGVSSSFFALLGLAPERGSLFTPEDEPSPASIPSVVQATPLPVVVSHALWRDSLARIDVPSEIDLAGRRVRVVGVLPQGVKFPGETNLWAPISTSRSRPPAFVRLSTGATLNQLRAAFPELAFTPVRQMARPAESTGVLLVWGAGAALLLMTWIQVAALMFMQSLQRIRAVGIQIALGASRRDLLRPALRNAFVLNAAAGLFAWWFSDPLCAFIVSRLPDDFSYGRYLTPDARTAAFTGALCLAGTLLVALVPALMTRRTPPLQLLRGELGAGALSLRTAQRALLAVQVGLTVFLIYSSGLAASSFARALSFDYGFDTKRALVFEPPPWGRLGMTPKESFAAFAAHQRKVEESVTALRAHPDVIAAAPLQAAPLGLGLSQELVPVSSVHGSPGSGILTRINFAGKDFVAALGAELVGGTSFNAPEFNGNENVAVINESLARKIVPAVTVSGSEVAISAVGKEVVSGPVRARVIGVIKNFVDSGPAVVPEPQMFLPLWSSSGHIVAVRTRHDGEGSQAAILRSLEPIWGRLPAGHVRPMIGEVRHMITPYRAQLVLLGIVVVCCLPIAAIGIAGALTHVVATRSHELAVRMALGANPATVMRTVASVCLGPLAAGMVGGCLLGAGAGRLVASQLFQTTPASPSAVLLALAVLTVVAILAAWSPARRATRLSPAVLLRHD